MPAEPNNPKGFPLMSVIILFLTGIICLTRFSGDTSSFGKIAPYIGYACLFLAIISTLSYMFTYSKKKK